MKAEPSFRPCSGSRSAAASHTTRPALASGSREPPSTHSSSWPKGRFPSLPRRRSVNARSPTVRWPEPRLDCAGHGHWSGPETWNLTCPSAVLEGNLKVRNWRQGDRMQPFGLDGTRKLSDLFREQRIATGERTGVLVVEDDEGIIWAVGLARAERTRLLHPGEPAVTITVTPRRTPNQNPIN